MKFFKVTITGRIKHQILYEGTSRPTILEGEPPQFFSQQTLIALSLYTFVWKTTVSV